MKGDIDKEFAQENLKRISANFELELLRLIKTLNLISQSNLFGVPREPALTPETVAGIVHEIRDYLNEIGSEIEKNKDEYLSKLDSVYSVYNLQLGASQTDLDIKLRELQKEISRVAEPNGSGLIDKGKAEDVTGIDYVKPTLQQAETVKPRVRILGIIVGVLFYDMLMRMWGVEEVSVVDIETSSVTSGRKEPVGESPALAKKEAKAPEAPAQTKAGPAAPPDAELPGQPPAEPPTGDSVNYTVVGVGANVRSGPGMGNDVVTVVKEGEVFIGLGEKQGRWVKIQAPDGKEGWISTKVIRETD
jgi:hypothetical protein